MKKILAISLLCICSMPAVGEIFFDETIQFDSKVWFYSSDAKGVGFRDQTPVKPVTGNNAATLGQQRLKVVATAIETWKAYLQIQQDLNIFVSFYNAACTPRQGILATAGPWSEYRNFTNAPLKETFYPIALANEIIGKPVSQAPEITVAFNLSVGSKNCLENIHWYYGLNGDVPERHISFYQIALHEIGRGLGFTVADEAEQELVSE